jgi:hypothetical protein
MQKRGLLIIPLIIMAFLSGFMVKDYYVHRNMKYNVNVEIAQDTNGITTILESGNLITDIGELFIRNTLCANNESDGIVKYISLSNDATPLVSWTQLPNEVTANGFDRNLGTVLGWVNSGDSAWNVTYQFTATAIQQLQCAGLNWVVTDDSDNNLFACATFTQTTFNSADTLTITWMVTVDAN